MPTETSSTKFQKVEVSFPKELVERLNEIIPRRQRSRFIAEAIEAKLARLELGAAGRMPVLPED